MRLAVVLTQPFFYDGQTYSTQQPFPLFVTSFAGYVDELLLFVPLKVKAPIREKENMHLLLPDNVKIIPYPFFINTRDLYKRMHKILPGFIRVFLKNIDRWDICWIVDSSLISFASYSMSRWKSKNTFLHLRADIEKSYLSQFRTILRKLAGYCLAKIEIFFIRIMTKKILTFVVSDKLFFQYINKSANMHIFYTNLISEQYISGRESRKWVYNKEVKLITLGRLVPPKGLEYLIDAVEDLVKTKGYKIICNIVGNGSDEKRLKELINQKNLGKYFIFSGFIHWGELLFDSYKESDIFVLPSLTEGFPKTIFEAMSFGVPVIATDVGGISKIVKHGYNGMLIKPRSSSELADSIHQVCSNKDLYIKLIKNGYAIAEEFTLEKQQRNMMNIIRRHFNITDNHIFKT